MAEDSAPLLHIGYQKTGSTWLQEHFFRSSSLPFRRADRRTVNEIFVRPSPLAFDPDAARGALAPFIADARAAGALPVLSQERLTGAITLGGIDSKEIAGRLAAVFPGARVLIVIRKQDAMILSNYKQYARVGGVMSLGRFLRPTKQVRSVPQFDPVFFEYDRLIRIYHGLFGPERVLVLAYEHLRDDPADFVARIYRFCEFEPPSMPQDSEKLNVSYSGPVLSAKRWYNLWFVGGPYNPGCIAPVGENKLVTMTFAALNRLVPASCKAWSDRRMLGLIRLVVGERYRESNARTSALTGLDLSRWNYDLPPEESGRQ